jgi:hypothetical protein
MTEFLNLKGIINHNEEEVLLPYNRSSWNRLNFNKIKE